MNQGSIVEKVVTYVVTQIVDDPDSVQVEIVPDGDDAIVIAGGRHGAADDIGLRILALDSPVSQLEQLHVAGCAQRLVAPLVMQVLFVPDLIGPNPAFVAGGHGTDKVGIIL